MKIDRPLLDKIAHLARLEFEVAERKIFVGAQHYASLFERLKPLAFDFQSVGAGLQRRKIEAALAIGSGAACLSGLFAG